MRPPSTPPSSAKTAHKIKDIPRFSIPDESASLQTPRQPNCSRKAPLRTPQAAKSAVDQLQTPATSKTSLFDTPNHTQMSPETPFTAPGASVKGGSGTKTPASLELTPEYTPAKSPRHMKRRRLHLDEFFQSSTDSIASLLLPNHSTVGSGRAVKTSHSLRAPISLDISQRSQLHDNLSFEQDFEQRKPQALLNANIPTTPKQLGGLETLQKEPKNQPGTPEKQLLSEAQVAQWYGKSYRGQFSDDEDSDAETVAKLENPFVDISKSKPIKSRPTRGNPFNSKSSVNYDTHLELINHRTGERRVELLTESQRKHKPRKLDFSNI